MNKKKIINRYDELFNEITNLTKKNNDNEFMIANPFLNYLNSSSKEISKYENLYKSKFIFPSYFLNLIKSLISLIISLLRLSIKRVEGCNFKKTDILFISHLTSREQITKKTDPYYGNIIFELEREGYSTTTVLINHIFTIFNDKNLNILSYKNKKIITPYYDNPLTEIKSFFNLVLHSIKWILKSTIKGDNVKKRFNKIVASNQISTVALTNLRIGNYITKIVKILEPKQIFLTWEGHGWERIVCKKCREVDKNIKIFGFQHSVLLFGPKSLSVKFGGKCDPNYILTPGKTSTEYFNTNSEYNNNEIIEIGSPKYRNLNKKNNKENKLGEYCILTPEGTEQETLLLTYLGIQIAKQNEKLKIILRLHPLIQKNNFTSRLIKKIQIPSNFEITNDEIISLEDDLIRSSWIIYRGSSVVFMAISFGLRPIFYYPEDFFSETDPIDKKILWRKSASSLSDIQEIIDNDLSSENNFSKTLKSKEYFLAKKYADEYFCPINVDKLKMCLIR